jgi:hypothetical protein
MHSWPLETRPVGSIVDNEWVQEVWQHLHLALRGLAARVLDVAERHMLRFGCMHTKAWVWAFRQVGTEEAVGGCAYCGEAVDESVLQARLRGPTRLVGFCDGCGFLYDGDPGFGRWLETDGPLKAGTNCRVNVRVRNPHRIAVPLSGVAVFDMHESKASSVSRQEFEALAVGEERTLTFDVPIPAGAFSGTHYLGAALMAGTQLNFFQRPVALVGRSVNV